MVSGESGLVLKDPDLSICISNLGTPLAAAPRRPAGLGLLGTALVGCHITHVRGLARLLFHFWVSRCIERCDPCPHHRSDTASRTSAHSRPPPNREQSVERLNEPRGARHCVPPPSIRIHQHQRAPCPHLYNAAFAPSSTILFHCVRVPPTPGCPLLKSSPSDGAMLAVRPGPRCEPFSRIT